MKDIRSMLVITIGDEENKKGVREMSEILYGKEAQSKLLEGVNLVANTIKGTLGPKARTVIIKKNGKPVVINDGVTIAKAIQSDDEFVQMGVELLQQVASEAQENTGDGTTTASILAQEMCNIGANMVNNGTDPIQLKKEIDESAREVVSRLEIMARSLDSYEDMAYVATIAANNDEKLGALIADVFQEIGKDGIITVEDSQTMETSFEIVQGMELDRGLISHAMMNNTEKGECVFDNALLLLTNATISNFKDLLPVLEIAVAENKPLLIISKELEGNALPNLLMNIMQQTVRVCAIRAPDFGDDQVDVLNDIAVMTGGNVINIDSPNADLKQIKLSDLGQATQIKSTRHKTVIVNDNADKEKIQVRVDDLNTRMDNETNDWFQEKIHKRIGKLTGGVAIIRVGAATETELLEKRERMDDALNATKAAIQEGIVVGGGMALWNVKNEMDDDTQGAKLVKASFTRPYNQLIENSGVEYRNPKDGGFNAKTGEWGDIYEQGVIDPVKVSKSAVMTATSIVGLILTTDVLVAEADEPEVPMAMYG
jgi:chaperonin GroEL